MRINRPIIKIPIHPILYIYRTSIISVLPYSLALALLYILIEPKTKPTFSDTTDWMALCLFILGSFMVCILHACIVYQMTYAITSNSADKTPGIFPVLSVGFRKMLPVFLMAICYAILIAIGLVAFVIPGIFLFIVGLLSLFIIVLKNTNPKQAFIESYQISTSHWCSIGVIMMGLVLAISFIEIIFDWIFTEQVVFDTLFSVLLRGLLWPLVYAMMLNFYFELTPEKSIADFQDSTPSRRNRKQKFLHTAPNQ